MGLAWYQKPQFKTQHKRLFENAGNGSSVLQPQGQLVQRVGGIPGAMEWVIGGGIGISTSMSDNLLHPECTSTLPLLPTLHVPFCQIEL